MAESDVSGVSLRPATPEDSSFVRKLYCDLRRPEFLPLGLEAGALEGLVNQQFDLRAAHYGRVFPTAETSIFTLGDEPVGYWIIDYSDRIRLIDFLVAEAHRGQGIGSLLFEQLLFEGDSSGQEIILNVEEHNPARRLYMRNGFQDIGTAGVYITMSRPPA